MTAETPRHGHAPIAMRRVADEHAIAELGDFAWKVVDGVRYVVFAEPCDQKAWGEPWILCCLPVTSPKVANRWEWDGNEEKPTLTPSVHTFGHWHGWVREGMLVEA